MKLEAEAKNSCALSVSSLAIMVMGRSLAYNCDVMYESPKLHFTGSEVIFRIPTPSYLNH